MTIHIKPCRILLYYDVPEIFVGIDTVGTQYLCLLAEEREGDLHYICTQISGNRLYEVGMGKIDIRTVFESPELPLTYDFHTNLVGQDNDLQIKPLAVVDPAFLPGKDLYLTPEEISLSGFSKIALQAAEVISHMPEEGQRNAYAAIKGIEQLYPQFAE
ncbi:hypothetical protein FACS1894140_5880 [Spirochaetia bacterium]|nr:hypothetical protein FACS1894140_5880 [Spirochaetia bacterium]